MIFETFDLENRVAMWSQYFTQSRDTAVLVAETENEIVGVASVGPSRDDDADEAVAELFALYVDPHHWDAGHGKSLMIAAITEMRRLGYVAATLWVLDTNQRGRVSTLHRSAAAASAVQGLRRPSYGCALNSIGAMNMAEIVVAALGASNVVVNQVLPERWYVAGNVTVGLGVYGAGRLGGVSNSAQGLGPGFVRRGLGLGLAGAALAAAGSLVAARLPATRHLFDDARATEGDIGYQTLVRIPVGTVVLEELAFRGTLPALIAGPHRSQVSIESAALFGLWHVLPTLNTLDINAVDDRRTRFKAVAAAVVATAAVGAAFDRLRLRTGSVLAPVLVHWAANAVSYAIAASRSGTAGRALSAPRRASDP